MKGVRGLATDLEIPISGSRGKRTSGTRRDKVYGEGYACPEPKPPSNEAKGRDSDCAGPPPHAAGDPNL